MAEALLDLRYQTRTGQGYDVHAFDFDTPGPVRLGGVDIDHGYKLKGHSDADVALFIGNNPIVSHYAPVGGVPPFSPSKRIRDRQKEGLKLIVADPRLAEVGQLADIYLPVKPGEDPCATGRYAQRHHQ